MTAITKQTTFYAQLRDVYGNPISIEAERGGAEIETRGGGRVKLNWQDWHALFSTLEKIEKEAKA
jgi:hypothetical protein